MGHYIKKNFNNNENYIFIYSLVCGLIGISLFLFGFFPINYYNENNKPTASMDDLPTHINNIPLKPNTFYKPLVKKLIIMVIDAFRWDFVFNINEKYNKTMFSTHKLLNNNLGSIFRVKVNIPTVTMPRIKSITTGTVSNFIDVVFNLGETRVSTDNILLQAKKHNHKLIFYGDDTWLQMYNDIFFRHKGTSSFLVSDFIQVDNNVTQYIDYELNKSNDWSIMILHYLGLDHIGHVYGPNNPLIKVKLEEMDKIIDEISTKIIQWNKQSRESLFIICGDHGMKNSGGHGGATPEETLVPLIAISGTSHYTDNNNNNNLLYDTFNQIDQIDITATLSVMLGIPLPSSNIGSVSLNMIINNYNLSFENQLYILYYNAKQVFNNFKTLSNYNYKQCYFDYLKAIELHSKWINTTEKLNSYNNMNNENEFNHVNDIIHLYVNSLQEMKNLLIQSMVHYNIILMSIAVALIFQVFIIIFTSFNVENNIKFSFKKFLYTWTFFVIFSYLLNYSLQNFIDDNNEESSEITNLSVANIIMIFILFNTNSYLISIRLDFFNIDFNNLNFLFLLATILHASSLGSSSFIEEEHQTWYFYWATFIVFIFIYYIKKRFINFYYTNNVITTINDTGKILFLLITHRLLRKLNSTGNKYAHQPDINGWLKALNQQSNIYMTFILLIALGLLLFILTFKLDNNEKYKRLHQRTKFIFYSFFLICVYFRHASEQNLLKLPFYPESRGIYEVNVFWIVCTIYLIYSIKNIIYCSTNTIHNLINRFIYLLIEYWILVSAILHRPYNIILLPIQLLTQIIIYDFFKIYDNKKNISSITYISYCIGNVFYFYQGNSNSLATIDVAVSCVGLQTYIFYIAGLFVCINTFSSTVLAYLMLIYYQSSTSEEITDNNNITICQKLFLINRQYALLKLFSLIVYTIIISIERYHLFVWSVFAPKLLYEAVHCAIIFVAIFIIHILIMSIKIIKKNMNICF
ncbi:GPI ethanolamine phosphate transferase 2 isoform X2 [Microplitis mediator]|uniref:GPI ethanolamine phosphate transferase 2 isoform X2 n=1 Tax=Microplitis mediator TaxID=375433 RepID=UPI0025524325|nr:GPI ethanolamine phosphate transferase 2 isoform X2 [Microplitis mediator]